jgi:hypothetical protein
VLPKKLQVIPKYMVADCLQLEHCGIGENVTVIESGSFQYTESLTKIEFPTSLVEIKDDAFMYSGIESINLGDSINRLGEGFLLGTRIREIVVPRKVEKLGTFALGDMSELKRIVLMNKDLIIDKHLITTFNDIEVFYVGVQNWDLENQFRSMEYDTFTFISGVTHIEQSSNKKYIHIVHPDERIVGSLENG